MSDAPVVHIGENSPEQVAYKLLGQIAIVEGRSFSSSGSNPADREWIIRTYCACLSAVKNPGWPDDAMKAGLIPG